MDLALQPLGWLHSLACLAALGVGAWMFVARKGTPSHRRLGQAYVVSMIVLNLTALGIYRLGMFFFPHVLAIVTLVVIAVGWATARFRQPRFVWKNLHLSSMIVSYYLLIGGGVNEVFLRIHALRAYVSHNGGQIIAQSHQIVMLAFLALLIGWNLYEIARAILRRSRRGRTALAPSGA